MRNHRYFSCLNQYTNGNLTYFQWSDLSFEMPTVKIKIGLQKERMSNFLPLIGPNT